MAFGREDQAETGKAVSHGGQKVCSHRSRRFTCSTPPVRDVTTARDEDGEFLVYPIYTV